MMEKKLLEWVEKEEKKQDEFVAIFIFTYELKEKIKELAREELKEMNDLSSNIEMDNFKSVWKYIGDKVNELEKILGEK